MAPQREWFEKDYYATLGVSQTATQKEITKAYRQLARENHPDQNPGDSVAEDRFKEASAAYDVLGDTTKRAEYDEVRRMGPVGGMAGGGPGGFRFDTSDLGDLGDLFGGLFNRGGRGARPGARDGSAATVLQAELPVIPVAWYQHSVTASTRLRNVSVDPLERSYRISRMAWDA